MKTSQFIREAVDSFLWNGIDPREAPGTPYLCICLTDYGKETNFNYKPLLTLIQEHVQCSRISEDRWGTGGWTVLPLELSASCEKNQAARFMFAEFLALQFEDMED